tara:strand:- start:2412 stop:3353 length:942 start_codon:yes stop_codon:yes gene_type:complete
MKINPHTIKKESNKNKKFWISQENFDRVIAYAESAYRQYKSEIGGQLVVIEDQDGDFILEDPVILKQEISAANCELDGQELAIHYSKMIGKYGNNVRHCWWHSHHTMGAFWSGTDHDTIISHPADDWTLSLVVNLKREYKLRIQFFNPFMHEENVELNFLTEEHDIDNLLDAEVKELCEKEKSSVVTYGGTQSQGHLWHQSQSNIRQYNQSYGYASFLDDIDDDIELTGVPANFFELCIEEMDKLSDDLTDGTIRLKKFRKGVKSLNEKLKQYNLQVIKEISKGTKEQIEGECLYKLAGDMFENIEKGVQNAN